MTRFISVDSVIFLMTVNPLPPQAYTRETLQKAYSWLLTQSASVKDLATTQDILVSMYLKAQRNGDSALDTPSIQNFKQELKSLANLIGDLQTPNSPQVGTPASPTQATVSYATPLPTYPTSQVQNTQPQTGPTNTMSNASIAFQQSVAAATPASRAPNSGHPGIGALGLDEQTLAIIGDVKNQLNLSSDIEAIRALVSLGYRQFKKI